MKRFSCFSFVFLYLILVCHGHREFDDIVEMPKLYGDGSLMFDLLVDYWSFAFTLLEGNEVIYNAVSPGEELINVSKTDSTQFGVLCVGDASNLEDQYNLGNLDFFPLFSSAVVPAYNIPGLAYEDSNRSDTPTLVLSRDTLADIFRGNIRTWNDTRIAADNPDVVLPNATIVVLVRSDPSSINQIWLQAMNSFVSDWQYGTNTTFSPSYSSVPHLGLAGDAMVGAISNIPFSIGYMTYGVLLDQGPVPYAYLINKAGVAANSTNDSVIEAMDSITDDETLPNFIDREVGWPIIAVSYQVIRKEGPDWNVNCEQRRELFKFYHWTFVSDTAYDRMLDLGCSGLGEKLDEKTINLLTTYTCNGSPVLEMREIEQHESRVFAALLAIAIVFMVLAIIISGVWHYLLSSRCNREVLLYQALQIFGIIVTYLSVIFWYHKPDSFNMCGLRRWFTCMGFTLVLTALFERTFRIHRVYGTIYKGSNLTANVKSLIQVGGGVALIILVQVIIQIAWTVADPLESVKVATDTINFEYQYECQSKYPNVWLSLEVSYFSILMIWGIYVVYSTWSLKHSILESRWILVSMYNNLLLLALVAVILPTVKVNEDLLFQIIVPFILLANTNVLVAVYCPAILKRLQIVISSSDNDNTKSTSKSISEVEMKTSSVL